MPRLIHALILLFLAGPLAATNHGPVTLRLAACGLRPADADYRLIYGDAVFMPRLELACAFSPKLSVWAAFSGLKKNGQGPLTGIACSSSQNFLAAGASYTADVSPTIALRLAAGPMLVFYREEAGEAAASGNALGGDLNAALSWALSSRLALEGRLGWLLAADRVSGGDRFRLGGPWAGLGVAVNF
jgi:hypothetical protein